MPLDNGYFIKDLDPSNPVGTIDKVSLLDDVIREVKGCVVNTFPSMDGEVEYSTDELNKMKKNFAYKELGWDMNGSTLRNVGNLDADDAVLPRSENDKRYVKIGDGLGDIGEKELILSELFADFNYSSSVASTIQTIMNNMAYPVGSLYMQAGSDENPNKILNVGVWVKFGQGRAIIGSGECNDGHETKTFKREEVLGSFTAELKDEHLPPHSHPHGLTLAGGSSGEGGRRAISVDTGTSHGHEYVGGPNTGTSNGGNKRHDNIQPSIAINIWKRTG